MQMVPGSATFASQMGSPWRKTAPAVMKHDDLEKDPLWSLLRESPAHKPGRHFAADAVRAARLSSPARPWWNRALIPLGAGGLLAGAAALVMVALSLFPETPGGSEIAVIAPARESFSEIQDGFETEVLIAVADHLGDYSDDELVSLIGF